MIIIERIEGMFLSSLFDLFVLRRSELFIEFLLNF